MVDKITVKFLLKISNNRNILYLSLFRIIPNNIVLKSTNKWFILRTYIFKYIHNQQISLKNVVIIKFYDFYISTTKRPNQRRCRATSLSFLLPQDKNVQREQQRTRKIIPTPFFNLSRSLWIIKMDSDIFISSLH